MLINYFLKKRPSPQGFALAFSLMIGLVMVLVAAAMLIRSNSNKSHTNTLVKTEQIRAAADTAITRLHSFFLSNSVLLNYSTDEWQQAVTSPNTDRTIELNRNLKICKNTTEWDELSKQILVFADGQKNSFGDNSIPGGEFSLKEFGLINNQSALVTIQANIRDSSRTLQAKIGFQNTYFEGDVPSLWLMKQGAGKGTDKSQFYGNLWVNNCKFPLDKVRKVDPYQAQYTTVQFPKLPDLDEVINRLPDSNILSLDSQYTESVIKFPRPTDQPTSIQDGRKIYEYVIDKVSLSSSQQIEVNTSVDGEPVIVIFYLKGNIDSSLQITHKCDSIDCPAEDFILLGYGGNYSKMCLKFDELSGFIFAPGYQLGIKRKIQGKAEFKGSAWVDELVTSGSCGDSNPYFYQNLDWKYILRDFQVVNPFPQNLSIIPGESLETSQLSTPPRLPEDTPLPSNSVPIAINPELQPNNPEGSPDTGNYP